MALNWKIFTQRPYIQSLSLEEQIRLFNIANEKSIRLRESKFQDFANSNSTSQGAAGDGDTGVVPYNNLYAMNFDGVNDYVEIYNGSTDGIQIADNLLAPVSNKYSISSWIRVTGGSGVRTIFANSLNGGGEQLALRVDGDGKVQFYIRYSAGSPYYKTITGTTVLSNDVWYHVAMGWDGSNIQLYVNGAADGSPVANTTWFGQTGITWWASIGVAKWRGNPPDRDFQGDIDEVAIWNNVGLTAEQISSIYNSGTPNDISSLLPTSWWNFNEGSGTTAIDSGTAAIDGALIANASYTTDVPT